MNEGNTTYKYSCRKCPIRDRCIESSDNSPTIKDATRKAFENRTDTLTTWARLQGGCLLIKAEEERKKGTAESLLARRLRRAREEKLARINQQKAAEAKEKPRVSLTDTRRDALGSSFLLKPDTNELISPKKSNAVQPTTHSSWLDYSKVKKPSSGRRHVTNTVSQRFWLTVARSKRNIALPTAGELVLGRFDPNFGMPPDVDLTYEDSARQSISRRHALINAQDGTHTIQEMGGKYGVKINGRPIGLGKTYQLNPSDRITLGGCEMIYEPVPRWVRKIDPRDAIEHWFMVNYTGQMIKVERAEEQIIGRRDKYMKFTPDIDLSVLEKVANKVSRRHACLTFKPNSNTLYLEDMGSGFGTKINGQLIMLGDVKALSPGDHVWLGGCVLTYTVTLK